MITIAKMVILMMMFTMLMMTLTHLQVLIKETNGPHLFEYVVLLPGFELLQEVETFRWGEALFLHPLLYATFKQLLPL